MLANIQDLLVKAGESPILKMTVAAAEDEVVIESVLKAYELNIINPILIGDKNKIKSIVANSRHDFTGEIIATKTRKQSAHKAMELINNGKADFSMKGLLSSSVILKALLDKRYNLRQKRLLSLVTLLYLKKEKRMLIITDGGMNINPGLDDKVQIVKNAVEFARTIGIDKPRVAPLAAVEKVNTAMQATLDAAALAKMADRGQIKNAIIDGPLAFDNAIDIKAARHKGINSPVAGKADILLAPDIESGNILYKSLIYYSGLEAASVVYGARLPLVLTSRADSMETKLNSIALGKLVTLGLKS